MKTKLILIFLFLPSLLLARPTQPGSIRVEEEDGSPSVSSVNRIKVANGTLTNNGGGSVSVATGGGGGVTDGDKGHITVSGSGGTWNVDASGMAAIAANSAMTSAFLGLGNQAADADPAGTALAEAFSAKLNATGGTATNTIHLGGRHTIRAIGDASTAQTISWTDFDTITLTLDSASCEITLDEGANLASGQDRTICIVVTQDGTGGRALTWAGTTLSSTPQINPRANAVSTIFLTTRNQGTNADAAGPEPLIAPFCVIAPNDLADANRDACPLFINTTGRTLYLTEWRAWSSADDTTLNLEEIDADGANNATVDAIEIATDGTGLYYASDTTITAATVENGHHVLADFDDTDTPAKVWGYLVFWP